MTVKKTVGVALCCGMVLALALEAQAASIRVRCEKRQTPTRSKISVDGNNLTPLNHKFRARVTSLVTGQTVTSALKQAVGDEVEFDFDSTPKETGVTPITPNFIQLKNGPDIQGVILDVNGNPVASASVDCSVK